MRFWKCSEPSNRWMSACHQETYIQSHLYRKFSTVSAIRTNKKYSMNSFSFFLCAISFNQNRV